jgi:prophage regulatory protein
MSAVVDMSSRRLPARAVPTVPLVIDRILRLQAVKDRVGLSRATIYRRIQRKEFPASVPLGGNIIGWRESEISAWIAALPASGES